MVFTLVEARSRKNVSCIADSFGSDRVIFYEVEIYHVGVFPISWVYQQFQYLLVSVILVEFMAGVSMASMLGDGGDELSIIPWDWNL